MQKFNAFYFVTLLFVISIISRVFFTSKVLYCWDSVQFALATENYNVSLYQPHPPGYILYVAFAKLLNRIFNDINYTLNFISIFFSSLAVVFLYLLAEKMLNKRCGIVSSLFLLFSPLLWFNSVISLPYSAECFFSIFVAYFCLLCFSSKKYIFFSTLALALAFGTRQNLILFLFPLWIYSAMYGLKTLDLKSRIKYLTLYSFILVFLCFLLFYITAYFSGGVMPYLMALSKQSSYVFQFSVFYKKSAGFLQNTTKVINSVLFGGLGVSSFIFLLYIPLYKWLKTIGYSLPLSIRSFFALWALPSFLFYCFVFIDPAGYVLTFLPIVIVVSSIVLNKIFIHLQKISNFSKQAIVVLVLAIIAGNSLIFVQYFLPAIRKNNLDWINTSKEIVQNFKPNETLIITSLKRETGIPNYFRHFMYYLPEYQTVFLPEIEGAKDKIALFSYKEKTYRLRYQKKGSLFLFEIPDRINYIVVGDKYLRKYFKINLEELNRVYFVKVEKGKKLLFGKQFLSIQ